jgi:membrane protease YdiL (CAAX protease family)
MKYTKANEKSNYRLSVYARIIVVSFVLVVSTLSVVIGLPLAKLMSINPADLSGVGFVPTFKTVTVVVLFAAFQFFLIWSVIRFIHKKSLKSLGFKGPVLYPLLIGTALGMIWAAAEYLFLHLSGSKIIIDLIIPENVSVIEITGYFLLNLLLLLTLNSLKEELVFRTYPINQFDDYPKLMLPLLIVVSLVFASLHHILVPFALDDFVSRFTIALVLCFVYYRWRSIWFIAGLHNGLNLLEYVIGGNYKMGGLLKISMEKDPYQFVSVAIDLGLTVILILVFQLIWKIEKQNKNLFFKIKHPGQF